MDDFCGSAFWNLTLLLDNTWPQLTPCFLNTVVTCAPCVYFWLLLPGYLLLTERPAGARPCFAHPSSGLHIGKMVCGSLLMALSALRVADRAVHNDVSGLVGDVVLLATLLAATLVILHERHFCVITSSFLFFFWLLKTISDIVPLYTKIMIKDYENNLSTFVAYVISHVISAAMLVLYCFADPLAVNAALKQTHLGKKPCPETTASFLNQLLFFWLTRLIITGYRRGVEMTDIWDLNPRDKTGALLSRFEKLWKQEEIVLSRSKPKHVPAQCPREASRFRNQSYMADDALSSGEGEKALLLGSTGRLSVRNGGLYKSTIPSNTRAEQKRTLRGNSSHKSQSQNDVFDRYQSSDNTGTTDYDINGPIFLDRRSRGSHTARRTTRIPSLLSVLMKQFGWTFTASIVQRTVADLFFLVNILLLGEMITYLSNRHPGREWQGYVMAGALFLSGILRTVIYSRAVFRSYYLSLQVKSVLIGAVYKKALCIHSDSRKNCSPGEVVNLMTVDAQRLQDFIMRFFLGCTVPVIVLIGIAVIYLRVGIAIIAGTAVLVVLVPLTLIIAVINTRLQRQNLSYKDKRVNFFSELLNGIKVVKLYAWEPWMKRRVCDVRGQEVTSLLRIAVTYGVLGVLWSIAPFLVIVTTYSIYVLPYSDHFLDTSSAFVIMSMFNILGPAFENFSGSIYAIVQAKVSVHRIHAFLCTEEVDSTNVQHSNSADHAICIQAGTFSWGLETRPSLENVDVTIAEGRLVAVVGQVGAGKSSLVNAVLGEMTKLSGTVSRKGKVGYVAQQAWIQNATLRDNVLFGRAYQAERYKAVIRACQLDRDLSILPAGDLTEIGEKGTNLSGGQRQRVSLARAVYSDSDIYLLDDPLSAVDSQVGKALFYDVIGPNGLLKGKTRVLVTHGLHWLPQVEEVVVVAGGRVVEAGGYRELMSRNGHLTNFIKSCFLSSLDSLRGPAKERSQVDEDETDDEVLEMQKQILLDADRVPSEGDEMLRSLERRRSTIKQTSKQEKPTLTARCGEVFEQTAESEGRLVLSETLVQGRVKWDVYLSYARAAGLVPMAGAFMSFCAFRGLAAGSNFWLRTWTADPFLSNHSSWGSKEFMQANEYYLLCYGLLGVAQVAFLIMFNHLFWRSTVKSGARLLDTLTHRLFRAPMAFFDTTPSGRIINRFSSDMEIVDNIVPPILRDIVYTFSALIVAVIVITIMSPVIAFALLPIAIICCFVFAAYIPTSRQCRRMEAVTRSPVLSHLSETVSGAATIRAYGATDRFTETLKTLVDTHQSFYFIYTCGLRWIQMNMDSVASIVTFMAALLEVASEDPSAGGLGLSVSYALQLSYNLNSMLKQVTDFETNIVAVERIKEYSEIDSEAPWVLDGCQPSPDWPPRGHIELTDLQVRYRPQLPLVLKGLNCTITGGEKIGVVGRTGAGKSSLSLALFRLAEAAEGAVVIDNTNIAQIGLHQLRNRLTILPQDPVLFSGTLRFNLDPMGHQSDEALWTALQQAHLHHVVQTLPGGLDFQCGVEGCNLSVGQRQLVCLARTLLKGTRVLVLDEATAAVDMETDTLIQKTVLEAFRDCTVITIAHRLHTVMDCDRIMVLDSGNILEFDTPQRLLNASHSAFSSMMRDAGLTSKLVSEVPEQITIR